jgi:hypothetical protein
MRKWSPTTFGLGWSDGAVCASVCGFSERISVNRTGAMAHFEARREA